MVSSPLSELFCRREGTDGGTCSAGFITNFAKTPASVRGEVDKAGLPEPPVTQTHHTLDVASAGQPLL